LELEQIAKRIDFGRAGKGIEQPLINFWGVPGIGKSWFLRHLQHVYRFQPKALTSGQRPTFTALFDFRGLSRDISPIPRVAKEMAEQVRTQLGSAMSDDISADLEKVLRWSVNARRADRGIDLFTNMINLLSQTFVPILLFDSSELVGEEVRDDLEERIIEPVIWNDRVIIVVAGRRQIPRWKRFEVRRRAADPSNAEIKPFEKTEVRAQLGKWGFTALADDVYAYSYGHPQTTELLGQILKRISEKTAVDSKFLIRSKQEFTDFLGQVEDHILEEMPPVLRVTLELIGVLRYFRIDPLRKFMVEFRGEEYQKKPDSFYLNNVIGAMEETNLVWWSRPHRAYVVSSVVRRIINRRLDLFDHDYYVRLHGKALAMYLEWIQEFPRNASEFLVEAVFHLAMLYKDSDQAKFREGIQARLSDAEKLSSEEANTLYEQLASDRELEDTLSSEGYHRLLKEFAAVRDHKSQDPN
jgi:hypothetical protein